MNTSLVLTVAASLTLAAACASPPPPSASSAPPVPVTIDRASTDTVATPFEAGGVVRARLTATIASRVMAPIAEVHVKAGDRVRQGSTLVTLDARELAANRGRAEAALTESAEMDRAAESDARAADAALRLARASYQRVSTLHDSRSATAQEFDEAATALAGAEARVSGAQARVAAAAAARAAAAAAKQAADVAASYAVLTAPFDGIVAERLVDPGTMAAAGMPLVVVEDPSSLRLEVQLDESRAAGIAAGQDVDVSIDSPGRADWCAGRIAEIGRVDAASHNFILKIDASSGLGARTGAFGRARFAGPTHQAVTVPEASVIRRGQLTFVFLVSTEDVARLRAIVVGSTERGRTEVLAGLAGGDLVVSNPPPSLTDGSRVTRTRP